MKINGFIPQGGHHCITTSLKQIFQYYNYPITEEMLFGLGSGLGFFYLNFSDAPMIGGREKIGVFENNISDLLKIGMKVRKPKNAEIAFEKLKVSLSNNHPILLYVDMPYLSYLDMNEDNHFGGHSVVAFGFNDDEECFYISDRDNSNWEVQTQNGIIASDYHKVPYTELRQARNSSFRPFPANNKWCQFDFSSSKPITSEIIRTAIAKNIDTMLNPPAKLLGVNGIQKFARETKKWLNFDDPKVRLTAINNYFMISHKGGTGGGIFRKMYGNFLIEASALTNEVELQNIGKEFLEIANSWENVADKLLALYETGDKTIIGELPSVINAIADKEIEQLEALQKAIA